MNHRLVRLSRGLILAITLAMSGPAAGQPAPATPAPKAERLDKVKQRARALRAYSLTEQLDLDEATAAKLFPALATFDDELDRLLAARGELQRRLGAAKGLDSTAANKLVDDTVANQRAIWDAEDRRIKQLRMILTPAQTARLLVVLPALERKLQDQMRRAAAAPAAPKPPRRPPASSGDLVENPFGEPRLKQIDHPPSSGESGASAKKPKPCDPFSTMTGCRH